MKKIIQEIIKNRDFSKFIGMKENEYFDAKRKESYKKKDPNERYELAKDVVSFANANGGFIIIGLKTDRVSSEKTEVVINLDLLEKTEFDQSYIKGVIKEHIHPEIENHDVKWVEESNKTKKGIGYIYIPPQRQDNKLFLTKNILEDGVKLKEIVFGISIRNESSSEPLTIQQLHSKIKHGMSSNSERLTRIENKIDMIRNSISVVDTEKNQNKLLDNRIKDILKNE
jgi:predicted HTH transcriptional regulator